MFGRTSRLFNALAGEGLADLWKLQNSVDLRVKLMDDSAGRARGGHDTKPDRYVKSRHARFRDTRQFFDNG